MSLSINIYLGIWKEAGARPQKHQTQTPQNDRSAKALLLRVPQKGSSCLKRARMLQDIRMKMKWLKAAILGC